MGRKCAVSHCKSGHRRHEHEKITIFSVPKNNIQVWSERLGCALNEKSCVCEKHFNQNDIKSEKIIAEDGKIIFQQRFSKKSLIKGAMPILNSDEPPMKLAKYDTSAVIEESQDLTEELQNISKFSTLPTNFTVLQNTKSQSDTNEFAIDTEKDTPVTSDSKLHLITSNEVIKSTINLCNTINKNDLNGSKFLFQQICANEIHINQPGAKWNFHKSLEPPILVFSELELASTPTRGENKVPVYTKKVILDDQLYVKIFIGQKNIVECISDLKCQEDLENLLIEVDKMIVCPGGPKVATFKKIHPQCAYKDENNKWRHNYCPTVVTKGSVCQYCVSLHKIFAQHIDRQRTSKKRLVLSPTTKNKVQLLYRRARVRARKLTRKETKIKQITEYIDELQKKMDEIETESLEKKIEKLNLPEPQVVLIRECISTARKKSSTNNRYSNEWMLTCLLLHIRSTATYNMLRENKILPLPSKSTICRYLRSSNTGCGFDEKFFTLFKIKLGKLPEDARHGILTFDEIQLRASLEINVKNMKFDGLIDFGTENCPDVPNAMVQADHALVFMFSSVKHAFHQPIGMFACKGATSGDALAGLVLKAIVEVEKAGGKVHGIICDGASTNRKLWTKLGISGKLKINEKEGTVTPPKYFFQNPVDDSRVVYAFSDAPHLIKCIRNNLFNKKKFKINGQEVEWRFYQNLFKEDKKLPANLRLCPKLTENHINPTNTAKMRVSFATQVHLIFH
ncbi:uncharacterized protein [Temnothorax longispinosus]|uniref:uncharacterized protein isoform X2 n=1 Tax=Temnothorax longispinosus TaxID=300112 RepID=UPI003A98E9FE